MTDQHTPGPWRWVPEPDTASPWLDYGDLYSASSEVVLSGWEDDFEEGVRVNSHEDARLIAAAPELLEALETLLNCEPALMSAKERKAFAIARAVIAKVRGKA